LWHAAHEFALQNADVQQISCSNLTRATNPSSTLRQTCHKDDEINKSKNRHIGKPSSDVRRALEEDRQYNAQKAPMARVTVRCYNKCYITQ